VPRFEPDLTDRPARVTAIRGIVFQNDGSSTVGRLFIRPLEALDRWIVGVQPRPRQRGLAIHAGIHVELAGLGDYVVEQLVGSLYLTFRNGLNWTPYETFAARDHNGWDVTVPATAFRGITATEIEAACERLNALDGQPFVTEDCTALVERAFDGHRLFADSPLLGWFGVAARIGDPALPLLQPGTPLEPRAAAHLQADRIRGLPDPGAHADSPNVQLWVTRLLPLALLGLGLWAGWRRYSSASRRSIPASSTARRFFK
jgi:hypothetical protein